MGLLWISIGLILSGGGLFFLFQRTEKFSITRNIPEDTADAVSFDKGLEAIEDKNNVSEEEEVASWEEKKSSDSVVTNEVEKDNSVYSEKESAEKESKDSTEESEIKKKYVSWGFEKAQNRSIDTVIVHSSYNALGGDKYNVDRVIAIYKEYKVSPHYMVDRDGTVYQLVSEKNIAYHAGVAKLPDGRTNVNAVSIGIELLNDDKGDAYTDAQYASLRSLVADIKKRHAIRYVLGHNDIAPDRKTDPWNFDWKRIRG